MARRIRLTGKEASVVRALLSPEPVPWAELLELTKLSPEDLVDILNGLISTGFVEPIPHAEDVHLESVKDFSFEANPAYAGELKGAIKRN